MLDTRLRYSPRCRWIGAEDRVGACTHARYALNTVQTRTSRIVETMFTRCTRGTGRSDQIDFRYRRVFVRVFLRFAAPWNNAEARRQAMLLHGNSILWYGFLLVTLNQKISPARTKRLRHFSLFHFRALVVAETASALPRIMFHVWRARSFCFASFSLWK